MISRSTRLGIAAIATLAFSAGAYAGKGEEHFKMMDKDGDGKVTVAEHDAAGAEKFAAADANKDGALTKGELAGFMIDAKGKSGRKAEKKADKKLDKMDANGDGAITLQEFTDGHKQMFSKLDANKDGAVSHDEAKEGHHH